MAHPSVRTAGGSGSVNGRSAQPGDGKGARYRGPAGIRNLAARRCASLNEATLFTTSPLLMNEADRACFARVEQSVRLSRYGGDCYAYCLLAAGHLDLVIETELKPHDVAALIPIVRGAGGLWRSNGVAHSPEPHRRV